MTQIVPVAPGFSEVVASGPQYGVKYVLTGMQGDGVRVVFNDPADADYVGVLTNISGLDSPDLRESADDLIGDDGGIHGNFYHGRRPIVLEGMIDNRPHAIHSELVGTTVLHENLVPNPSWNTDTQLNAASSTLIRSLGTGNPYGEVTHNAMTGTTSAIYYGAAAGAIGTAGIPVIAGQTYSARVKSWAVSYSAGTITSIQLRIRWYDSAGTTITDDTLQTSTNPGLGAFISQSGTATAPANAAYANVLTYAVVSVSGGNLVFRSDDALLVKEATPPTFFTGGTSPTFQEPSYTRWTGTANLSTSQWVAVENVEFTPNRVRNIRMTALQRVTNAMRKDMQMRWQPEGGVEQVLYLRRQQPLRITGAYNKSFQAGLVAADPRIYASAIQETRMNPGVQTTVRNNGSIRTQPVATIYGPTTGTMTGIELHNHTTGEYFVFAPAYALASGQYIVIDFANKTVTRENGTNIYDQVQFASSVWWQIEPGDNLIELHGTGTTTNANCVLRWQDAWV